jgi:hypothetical protein
MQVFGIAHGRDFFRSSRMELSLRCCNSLYSAGPKYPSAHSSGRCGAALLFATSLSSIPENQYARGDVVPIVRREKAHSPVGELLSIFDAALRHFNNAFGNHFPHGMRICRACKLAARLFNALPGIVEGRCEHLNTFGIESRFRSNRIGKIGHSHSPRYTKRERRPTASKIVVWSNQFLKH